MASIALFSWETSRPCKLGHVSSGEKKKHGWTSCICRIETPGATMKSRIEKEVEESGLLDFDCSVHWGYVSALWVGLCES